MEKTAIKCNVNFFIVAKYLLYIYMYVYRMLWKYGCFKSFKEGSPYSDIAFFCLHFLVLFGLYDSTLLFGNIVALNSGLGGVRDVAFTVIYHEQSQLNRVCCFQTSDAVFSKDLFFFSDYLEITTGAVVPCAVPKRSYFYIFQVLLDCKGQQFYLGT